MERHADFSAFFAKKQATLFTIAYRVLRDREAALDALQETAILLFRHWDALDHGQNADGWLYRVLLHACYRWLRGHRPRPPESHASAPSAISAQPTQEDHLRTHDFQRFLARALEGLSEQERLAYIFRDLHEASGKEVAHALGCEETTARGYYFSARKKLALFIQTQAPEWLGVIGKGNGL